ncbi:MAG: hypothetical protein OXI96_03205 [Acidimicrobiaceae bacterium]|nr:hypothetical protein [Acidimicrobiaceae bacterium]
MSNTSTENTADPENTGKQEPPMDPTPSVTARILAFGSIVISGTCGGLIGFAVIDLQCNGECQILAGIVGSIAASATSIGTAIVAILMLRSSIEWRTRHNLSKTYTTTQDQTPPTNHNKIQ